MAHQIFRFAEVLRSLLEARSPEEFERVWQAEDVGDLGWGALRWAWRHDEAFGAPVVDEVDGLLLRLLKSVPALSAGHGEAALRARTFRLGEIERLQHAAAAALVAQRFGVPGLCTVVGDSGAPLARRYFSFCSLAERHPPKEWPLISTYLAPEAHHAFLGAAAETARFYGSENAAERLVELFDETRADAHLRSFLSPRILVSLFVLNDPCTLPFFRDLLTGGYTAADPAYCEVTCALVMVRRFTGVIEANVKFLDLRAPQVSVFLDNAEDTLERRGRRLHPVAVI